METKQEIAYSWDWKQQPNMPKIMDAIKMIFAITNQIPNCYNVETKTDSYGILITSKQYHSKKEISDVWWELLEQQND